jgi:hypothetical protein
MLAQAGKEFHVEVESRKNKAKHVYPVVVVSSPWTGVVNIQNADLAMYLISSSTLLLHPKKSYVYRVGDPITASTLYMPASPPPEVERRVILVPSQYLT